MRERTLSKKQGQRSQPQCARQNEKKLAIQEIDKSVRGVADGRRPETALKREEERMDFEGLGTTEFQMQVRQADSGKGAKL